MSPLLDSVMLALSAVGYRGAIWIGIVGAGVAVGRLGVKAVWQVCLALLLALIVSEVILKPLVREPRPYELNPHAVVIGHRPGGYSFPSGHATTAFSGFAALSLVWPGGRVVWGVLAALISYSRVYLGVHSWFDVAGGVVIGLACGYLAVAVGRRR